MKRPYLILTLLIMSFMLTACVPKTLPLTDEDYETEQIISVTTESVTAPETEAVISEEIISETEIMTIASETETELQTEEETEMTETSISEDITTAAEFPDTGEIITESTSQKLSVEKDGSYTSPEDVAEYIHTFGTLPGNFITKKEAKTLGWSGGSLKDYAPGKSIGGDTFGNYEGLLPEKKGRKYTECDVNYTGGKRGAERIIFSDDGLIFYTDDHYASFTQLY